MNANILYMIITFLKQSIYTCVIFTFVLLTSCTVKSTLYSLVTHQSGFENNSVNNFNVSLTNSLKCAVGNIKLNGAEPLSLKMSGLFTPTGPRLTIFNFTGYRNEAWLNLILSKLSDPPEIWLLFCTLRL